MMIFHNFSDIKSYTDDAKQTDIGIVKDQLPWSHAGTSVFEVRGANAVKLPMQ